MKRKKPRQRKPKARPTKDAGTKESIRTWFYPPELQLISLVSESLGIKPREFIKGVVVERAVQITQEAKKVADERAKLEENSGADGAAEPSGETEPVDVPAEDLAENEGFVVPSGAVAGRSEFTTEPD